ncbi:MAG: hypothetical protein ACR2FM_01520 [Candidatus Saccharimonadales bacterium]
MLQINYFETGLCSLKDYETEKENRLREADIVVDSSYLAVFSLATAVGNRSNLPPERQAIKWPVLLKHKETGDTKDVYVITFNFINHARGESETIEVKSFDGLLIDPAHNIEIDDPVSESVYSMQLGYLQNHQAEAVSQVPPVVTARASVGARAGELAVARPSMQLV